MSRVKHKAQGETDLDQVWGLRPDFYREFMADHSRSIARVDPVIVELCRLRLAQMFQCSFSSALRYWPAAKAGLNEAKIADLPRYYNSPLFTPQERVCIEFAEMFALGAANIGDDDVKKLESAIGAEPMIYLLKALSVMDQLQRTMVAFQLAPPRASPSSMPEFVLADAA